MRPETSTDGYNTYCAYKSIIDAVISNHGIPIGIFSPVIDDYIGNNIDNTQKLNHQQKKELEKIFEMVDGVICQGGDDFYDYDIYTINYCHQNNIPLLGICLGMQTMACAFNGELVDIGNNSHKLKGVNYAHNVILKENSHLYKILGQRIIKVNSRHKCKILKTDLKVSGISDDGIIEAVEDPNHKFFIGVQWHPETMIEYDILMNRLFTYFINICK